MLLLGVDMVARGVREDRVGVEKALLQFAIKWGQKSGLGVGGMFDKKKKADTTTAVEDVASEDVASEDVASELISRASPFSLKDAQISASHFGEELGVRA